MFGARPLLDWQGLDGDQSAAVAGVFLETVEMGFVQLFFQLLDVSFRVDNNQRFAIDYPVDGSWFLVLATDDICDKISDHYHYRLLGLIYGNRTT